MPAIKDKHHLLRTFCTIVHFGSFNKAAEYLGLPVSSVSKNIKQLENQYKTQLIIRNTRAMQLTDVGNVCYEKAKDILKSVDELEKEIQTLTQSTSGKLRISLPKMIGETILTPFLASFMIENPNINLELDFSHETSNLIEQDFDIVFRTSHSIPDNSLFEIKLLALKQIYVASPHYISVNGKPSKHSELINHTQLQFHSKLSQSDTSNDRIKLISNSYQNIITSAKCGVGIACVYDILIKDELASGELIQLLKKTKPQTKHLSILYRQRSNTSNKIQTFVDYFAHHLKD